MHFSWNQISEVLSEAEKKSLTIEFESERLAILFRYSIYNFRRKKKLYQDLKIILTKEEEQIETDDKVTKFFITIYNPIKIYIKSSTSLPPSLQGDSPCPEQPIK